MAAHRRTGNQRADWAADFTEPAAAIVQGVALRAVGSYPSDTTARALVECATNDRMADSPLWRETLAPLALHVAQGQNALQVLRCQVFAGHQRTLGLLSLVQALRQRECLTIIRSRAAMV